MSEREFEIYLSLLAKFLKLRPDQRSEIADELRDHLEERHRELMQLGYSRDDAIARALHEFGDAADLAAHFSALALRRKRRFLMRCTAASVAVLAGALFLGNAFWPDVPQPQSGPARVIAQEVPKAAQPAVQPVVAEPKTRENQKQAADLALEKKLDKVLDQIEFMDTPLGEVLTFLSSEGNFDVIVDVAHLAEAGIEENSNVSLSISRTPISIRTALELILERVGGLTYRVRSGILFVTTEVEMSAAVEVRVYNVRDLVGSSASAPAYDTEGMGLFKPAQFHGPQEGAADASSPAVTGVSALIATVQSAAVPGTWGDEGGTTASVTAFDGLLIVRQSAQGHREVEALLQMLREAAAAKPAAPQSGTPTYSPSGELLGETYEPPLVDRPSTDLETPTYSDPLGEPELPTGAEKTPIVGSEEPENELPIDEFQTPPGKEPLDQPAFEDPNGFVDEPLRSAPGI